MPKHLPDDHQDMIEAAQDNPSYITIANLPNGWHVNKMEWDARADDYLVSSSERYHNRAEALMMAVEKSRSEGIELR